MENAKIGRGQVQIKIQVKHDQHEAANEEHVEEDIKSTRMGNGKSLLLFSCNLFVSLLLSLNWNMELNSTKRRIGNWKAAELSRGNENEF